MTNFRLHDEQRVNGLRKITWASIFRFPFEKAAYAIYIYIYTKVGTRYFFLSPLPLVRFLEIVVPLRAGPLFSKLC